jgi:hypothetical protein
VESAFCWPVTFLLVRAPPVVIAIPRSAARVSDVRRPPALDVSLVSDGVSSCFAAAGVGVLAVEGSGVASGCWPASVSAVGDGSLAVEESVADGPPGARRDGSADSERHG